MQHYASCRPSSDARPASCAATSPSAAQSAQRYAAGGLVFPLALKDVRLALAEAEAAGVPMPSVSVVRDRLITGMARGYAELDWSALALPAAEESGLGNGAHHTGTAAPR